MPDHKGDSGPCIMNSSKSAALPTVAKSGSSNTKELFSEHMRENQQSTDLLERPQVITSSLFIAITTTTIIKNGG